MFNFFKQKNSLKVDNKRKRGFTIIESLVAIFILLISITGPLYFTQGALRVAFVARDQITAFFLAQDAIEYVKNVRDKNSITNINGGSDNWLSGLSNCLGVDGCTIDTTNNDPTPVDVIANPSTDTVLKIDTASELFNHTSGNDSIYSRSILIEEIVGSVEAIITVKITWKTHEAIGERTIEVKEHIFNWAVNL